MNVEERELVVQVKNVKKSYGEQKVLDDVCLELEKGKIYGLVGRNGSGKTVLMKCILGLCLADAGEITVYGHRIGKEVEFAENVGFIIEEPGFFPNRSGYENLRYMMGIRKKPDREAIMQCLAEVGLDDVGRKKVGKYSMGMRQRLGIAQAIMERPSLLILDEPMNGLDNDGVRELREKMLAWKEQGITILLASHNREDIEVLCDEEYEMDKGKLTRREINNSKTEKEDEV